MSRLEFSASQLLEIPWQISSTRLAFLQAKTFAKATLLDYSSMRKTVEQSLKPETLWNSVSYSRVGRFRAACEDCVEQSLMPKTLWNSVSYTRVGRVKVCLHQQDASDSVNNKGSYELPALEVSDSNPWTWLQRRTRTPVDYVIGVPGFACMENRTEPEISPKSLKTLMPGEPSYLLNGFLTAGDRQK